MIEDNLKIYCSNEITLKDTFFISNGTESLGLSYRGNDYDFYVRKPKEPWIEMPQEEISKIVVHHKNLDFRSNFGLIKVPESVQKLFNDLSLSEVNSYDELKKLRKEKPMQYINAMDALDEYFSKFLITGSEIHKIGIHIGDSNNKAATKNADGTFTGLHIDYWDQLELKDIEKASNRISINLGKDDRYIMFIGLTLEEIFKKIRPTSKRKFEDYDVVTLLKAFFDNFPNYPVMKIRIKPYEAYIAPTENVIHDGSTEGNYTTDITLTTRGCFKLGF